MITAVENNRTSSHYRRQITCRITSGIPVVSKQLRMMSISLLLKVKHDNLSWRSHLLTIKQSSYSNRVWGMNRVLSCLLLEIQAVVLPTIIISSSGSRLKKDTRLHCQFPWKQGSTRKSCSRSGTCRSINKISGVVSPISERSSQRLRKRSKETRISLERPSIRMVGTKILTTKCTVLTTINSYFHPKCRHRKVANNK